VCAAECVDSAAAAPLRCLDDTGCCDGDGVCSDEGVCVVPGGAEDPASDDDPSQEGGCNEACGDRDNDGVRNGCDQKPDESCSADADNDGCNDSCDADDESSSDGCGTGDDDGGGIFCRLPRLPRPNSTFWALVVLYFVRGRRARR
jgi:hypothetical protein